MLPVRPHGPTPPLAGAGTPCSVIRGGGLGSQRQVHRRPLQCLLSGCAHHEDLGLGESTALPRAQVCQDLCSCSLPPAPQLPPTLVTWP